MTASIANETKHTQGPWEFRAYTGGCTIVSSHNRPGSSVRDTLKGVAIMVDAVVNDDQSNVAVASPDARLIVAAPDLLSALRLCVARDSSLKANVMVMEAIAKAVL